MLNFLVSRDNLLECHFMIIFFFVQARKIMRVITEEYAKLVTEPFNEVSESLFFLDFRRNMPQCYYVAIGNH